jgi:hypothetical protein
MIIGVTMENVKPQFNIIHNEKPPDDKIGILLLKDRRINEAKTLDEQIDAYIDFINVAVTDIPDVAGYDKLRWSKLEPSYADVRRAYLKDVYIPWRELEYQHVNRIMLRQKVEYKRILQTEVATVISLLTKYKGWVFNKAVTQTLGK